MVRSVDGGFALQMHRIPAAQLAELCAGGGGVATMRTLWSGQRSRRLLMLGTAVREALDGPGVMGPLPAAESAWSALYAADGAASEECSALLLHPQIGSWAAYTLRRSREVARTEAPFWIDAGVLHTIALIASAKAGRSWQTRLPARNGRVMLPTLGMAHFAGLPRWSWVAAGCHGSRIRLERDRRQLILPTDPSIEAPGWWPLRRLRAGDDVELSVFLEDIDPFRELADPVDPERLDDEAANRWALLVGGAWSLLCRQQAETARALAGGIVSLVPLPADELGTTRSASTGEAFGSVMVSPPIDEIDLAVSLVHEFQHIKLGGLMHLVTLTEGHERPDLHAPWRDDPRPLAGLLQGVYAFFGIADFWRLRRRSTTGAHRSVADFEFEYARLQVDEALRELAASGGLTRMGRRLVEGLSGRLRSWRTEFVERSASAAARLLCASHRAEWRLRHLRPDDAQVSHLAAAWPALDVDDPGPIQTAVQASPDRRWSHSWQELTRSYVTGRLERGRRAEHPDNDDLSLLAGDGEAAGNGYRQRIADDPSDLHAWAGLSLTAGATEPMRRHPEVVLAVHTALRGRGLHPDPRRVSQWLARVAGSTTGPVGTDYAFDPLEA